LSLLEGDFSQSGDCGRRTRIKPQCSLESFARGVKLTEIEKGRPDIGQNFRRGGKQFTGFLKRFERLLIALRFDVGDALQIKFRRLR
jgi:hypothetical protein